MKTSFMTLTQVLTQVPNTGTGFKCKNFSSFFIYRIQILKILEQLASDQQQVKTQRLNCLIKFNRHFRRRLRATLSRQSRDFQFPLEFLRCDSL